ncbi:TerB family tellurite resistance protein [Vibrio aestuarianus]|uniref:TerB domain-containing protein n=1 Tax=Vibrio aestuarianus TaxID=28171 RepID=A0ABM9FQ00_9VIBR|nr:TerB family tellurite resistance protein [Vibrio aestuarianus]MDE1212598.1 TerB family tellurite resistance protein [Vibrio aestuarianus]MDE1216838.1 TerB family tellurite resistance protein [Vibrio aestuarianus]MDE1224483.1 TerB family tellurite resistance protein [Vibrio aestuarianus]MDE1228454.1 TerB family tellurite resistance protein [Vibrio aestuarianus]MDE1256578.1 TerB family tellurite resistance protein [Vibrio aestuarianus]
MFNAITSLFKQLLDGQDLGKRTTTNPNLAITCLLKEVAGADHQIDPKESEATFQLTKRLLNLDDEQTTALLQQAKETVKQSASLYDFTSQLRELTQETRYELIKAMWEVANADGEIDPLEDAVIRKTAELLYVDHSEFIRAKLSIRTANN